MSPYQRFQVEKYGNILPEQHSYIPIDEEAENCSNELEKQEKSIELAAELQLLELSQY